MQTQCTLKHRLREVTISAVVVFAAVAALKTAAQTSGTAASKPTQKPATKPAMPAHPITSPADLEWSPWLFGAQRSLHRRHARFRKLLPRSVQCAGSGSAAWPFVRHLRPGIHRRSGQSGDEDSIAQSLCLGRYHRGNRPDQTHRIGCEHTRLRARQEHRKSPRGDLGSPI